MKTLTINLPDKLDPAVARWEMARSLYEKGDLTADEAAEMAELAPTYFRMRLQKPVEQEANQRKKSLLESAKPLDRHRFDQLVGQLAIGEPWEKLVTQIGK